MDDDDKQFTITLDPTYTYSGGAQTGISTVGASDYSIPNLNSGTFTISTGSLNTGTDMEYEYDSNIHVPEHADITIGNKSLKTFMDTMEKRMAILQPDPRKLEKFEALKKAYEHYKHLEALCEIQEEEDDHDGSIDY
jgi:hypothetical protein